MKSSKENHLRWPAGLIAVILAAIVLFAAGFGLYFKQALSPINVQNKKEMKVVIPNGTSVAEISRILQKKGLIREAWVFQYYAKIRHLNQYRAGTYYFSRAMSVGRMIHDLESGKQRHAIVLSVQEGQWVKDIAANIAKVSGLKEQDVLDKMSDRQYIRTHYMKKYPFLSQAILQKGVKYPLEGYLSPGIYQLPKRHVTLDIIINKMLAGTQATIEKYQGKISKSKQLGSVHEVLTMASLIEQEAPGFKDRQKIAGVFYNRLNKKMRLQTDPSVAYSMQRHAVRIYFNDLKTDSPYNTYRNAGLPIGPIGNPSAAAIAAALSPVKSNNLYFYSRPSGQILYSDTFKKHEAIIKKYKHEWANKS